MANSTINNERILRTAISHESDLDVDTKIQAQGFASYFARLFSRRRSWRGNECGLRRNRFSPRAADSNQKTGARHKGETPTCLNATAVECLYLAHIGYLYLRNRLWRMQACRRRDGNCSNRLLACNYCVLWQYLGLALFDVRVRGAVPSGVKWAWLVCLRYAGWNVISGGCKL